MASTELSAHSLKEGVEAHFKRKDGLGDFENQEVEAAIGATVEEKQSQGFRFIMIVYAVYAPFFLSDNDEIKAVRQRFFQANGGVENVEYYLIERTGEVVVLMK